MRQTAVLLLALLLASALPTVPAQATKSQDFILQDNENDVKPRSSPAGVPVAEWLDLKSLRIHDEDLEGLGVELIVKSLKRPPSVFWSSAGSFSANFKLDGTSFYYLVQWIPMDAGPDNQTPNFRTNLCIRTRQESNFGGQSCSPRQRAFGGADYSKNRLWAYLPKLSLMGKDPADGRSGADLSIQIPKGARFVNINAQSSQWSTQFEDRLPDVTDGGPYELQQPAANDRVRIKLTPKAENQTEENQYPYYYPEQSRDSNDFPKVSVEPGVTTLVRLDVLNLNGAKRIVNLSAQLADKADGSRWEVRIAPAVQIPGGETRSVNLIVNATGGIEHRQNALVRIVGQSYLFKDEIGALTLRLVASVPPSVAKPTLYFHAATRTQQSLPGMLTITNCDIPFLNSWGGCDPTRFLNTLETDPTGDLDEEGDKRGGSFSFGTSQIRYSYPIDAALSRDVVMDPKQAITGVIQIKSTAALDGSVELNVNSGGKLVGGTKASAALPQGGGAVTLNFLPTVEGTRLKNGDKLTITLTIEYETLGASAPAMVSPPFFVPKGSKITFPIIEDPNATVRQSVPAGDAFLGLTRITKDDQEFAYPGRARVFEMSVVNEGGLEDVANIEVQPVSGICEIEVRPGYAYKLEAGDSAKFGVLLRPGTDAKEGEQCHVQINATSTIDPAVQGTTRVSIVVTRGIDDLPDDSKTYLPDKESEQRAAAASPKAKSPAAGLFGAIVALVGIALVRRRR